MNELIHTLTQTWGPTSYEEGIRGVITRELNSLHMDCRVDALGNLIYCIPASGKPKLLVSAHMDQIGYHHHARRQGWLPSFRRGRWA